MNVQLSDEQVSLLKRVLTDDLSDLRMQITDTEDYDLRQALKHDEQLLLDILTTLGERLQPGENLLRRIA